MRMVPVRPPSSAMMVALLALFVALGGTGYAASEVGTRAGNGIAAHSAKRKPAGEVARDTGLFKQLFARSSDAAKDSSQLSAYLAANAVPNATHAGSANPTGPAGGALSGSYPDPSLAGLPPITTIPLSQYLNGWNDYGEVGDPAGYYKDALGIVHLTGAILGGTPGTAAFRLPAGYLGGGFFASGSSDAGNASSGPCTIVVGIDIVFVMTGCDQREVGLDGITYRPIG